MCRQQVQQRCSIIGDVVEIGAAVQQFEGIDVPCPRGLMPISTTISGSCFSATPSWLCVHRSLCEQGRDTQRRHWFWYGVMFGIFSVGIDLIRFAVERLTTTILWMWIAGSLISFAIMGALVGAIYKPKAV